MKDMFGLFVLFTFLWSLFPLITTEIYDHLYRASGGLAPFSFSLVLCSYTCVYGIESFMFMQLCF